MTTTTTTSEENAETTQSPPPAPRVPRLRARAKAQATEETGTPDNPTPMPDASSDPRDVDGAFDDSEDAVAARAKKYERLGLSKPLRQARDKEDESLLAWLGSMSSDAPIRVQVHRKEPKEFIDPATGQRKKVDGMVRRYDRPIDEEEIQRNHGGGTFQLVITKRNHRGQYEYLTARTIEIAGDPRLDDVGRVVVPQPPQPPPQSPLDSPVVGKLMDHLLHESRRPPPPAPDISSAVQVAVAPFRDAIHRMETQLDRKDQELAELRRGDPGKEDFTQRMLDKFIDQDSARLQQVRMQFESEIRMIKESAVANEQRLRDQFERDKEHLHRAHERELATLKSANDLKIAALEQSFAMQKTVLESDNRRLERELSELRIEVKELRNKKEPSFKDQLAGIRDMKEMVDDVLGNDGDEKEDKPTIVKVLEGAAQSDVIAGFAQRMMSGAAGGGTQMPMVEQPPPQRPAPPRRRGPKLIRDRRNGQVYATDGQRAIPVQKKPPLAAPPPQPLGTDVVASDEVPPIVVDAADQNQPQESPVQETLIPYIPPETVGTATDYMTKAYGNSIDPETFVIGVKMFIPPEVVDALRQMGPEAFLRKVGGLPDDHPLLSQAGKNWVRKVSKHLVGE